VEGLAVGRIVHFVLENGEHRPGIVVRIWPGSSNGSCQLQVFTDSTNDDLDSVVWRTSVPYSEEPKSYTWHWPERA
jgi:hypothetical protein